MSVSPTLSRRSLVRGSAWSAPVLLASTTVPAYAASRCTNRTINFDASWGTIIDSSGSHTNTSTAQKTYLSASDDKAYDNSWQSRTDTQYGSGLTYAEYSISRQIEVLVADQPITMTIPFSTGLANNSTTTSMEQRVTVLVDNVELDKVTTRTIAYDKSQYYPSNEVSAQVSPPPPHSEPMDTPPSLRARPPIELLPLLPAVALSPSPSSSGKPLIHLPPGLAPQYRPMTHQRPRS